MTQQINTPGGVEEFSDDLTLDQINAALRKKYPARKDVVANPLSGPQQQITAQQKQAAADAAVSQAAADPEAAAHWGGWLNAVDPLTLGFLPQIMAGAESNAEAQSYIANAPTGSDAALPDYQTQVDYYQKARDAWRQQNPGMALVTGFPGAAAVATGAAEAMPEAWGVEALAPKLKSFAAAPGMVWRALTGAGQAGVTGFAEKPGDWSDKFAAGAQDAMWGGLGSLFLGEPLAAAAGIKSNVGRTVASAVPGGVGGGLYGYLTSGGDPSTAEKYAAGGAALTATGGAAAPYLAQGAQALADILFHGNYGARAGLTPDAADRLNQILQYSRQTPEQAAQTVRDLGPGGVLADANPATRGETNELRAKNEDIAPTITRNLEAREEHYLPTLNAALEKAIGPNFNGVAYVKNLQAQTEAHANTLYAPFRNNQTPLDVSDITNPIDAMAARRAQRGAISPPADQARIDVRAFLPKEATNVTMQEMDEAIKGINEAKNKAYLAGNGNEANAMKQVRNQLLDKMPLEYRMAHNAYASDKAIENAYDAGKNFFSSKLTDEEHLAMLNELTDPERKAYQAGTSKAIYNLSGTSAKTAEAGAMQKFANENGFSRANLAQTFGGEQAQGVFDAIDNLERMKRTNQFVLGGSKTAETLRPRQDEGGVEPPAGAETGRKVGERIGEAIPIPGAKGAGKLTGEAVGASIGGMARPFSEAAEEAARQYRESLANILTMAPSDDMVTALVRRGAAPDWQGFLSSGAEKVARALGLYYGIGAPPTLPQR
jgi:hypothetical protein